MATIRDMLQGSRALIANPEHWCIGELAIDDTGARVDTSSEYAYAFCAAGAVHRYWSVEGAYRADFDDEDLPARCLASLNAAARAMGFSDVPMLNDWDVDESMTAAELAVAHGRVLACYDAAIAAA